MLGAKFKNYLKKALTYRNQKQETMNAICDDGNTWEFHEQNATDHALERAKALRNVERKPTIIIHGLMQRTGTVYVGELLRLHPDMYAFPMEVWEIPFLQSLDGILEFQKQFFNSYKQNVGKIGQNDFLPLFGAAFIDYLYSQVPEGKQMLLKVPSVRHLNYFYTVFPNENLILLMRDGRDVVASTLKTWPDRDFPSVCRRWQLSARMALDFNSHYRNKSGYLFARYEDIFADPRAFVNQVFQSFELDSSQYPYDLLERVPVRGSSSISEEGNVSWKPVDKPTNFNPVKRWQTEWTVDQKRIFKEIAGQTLIDCGYAEDLNW